MLVAPLDANTLGKVASGICDNLLVSDSLYNFLPGPYSLLSCRLPLYKALTLKYFHVGPVCSEHTPAASSCLTCAPAMGQKTWS